MRFTYIYIIYNITLIAVIFTLSKPLHKGVYVPGGGFSGFWYTLGKLEELKDAKDKEYYCYSSGCLAVTSMFMNKTFDQVLSTAVDIQTQFNNGTLHRYDVLEEFIDQIVDYDKQESPSWLSKINIITSNLFVNIIKPRSISELKDALHKSAFIPFITGYGFAKDKCIDGFASLLFHPRCTETINIPYDLDMILNVFNVNMKDKTAARLYYSGKYENSEL